MRNSTLDPLADSLAQNAPLRGVRGFIHRIPTAIIALLLALAALAAAHYFDRARAIVFFTPFVAGAVQRTNWWHLLAALFCGAVAFAAQSALRSANVEHFYVLSPIIYPAIVMILVGAMEWLLRGWPGRTALASILAACLAAAAIFAIVQTSLACTERTVSLAGAGGGVAQYRIENLTYFPLEGVLLWIAIPMGLTPSPRRRSVLLGASAAALVLYVAFATIYVFDVARESLFGQGPFGRAASARLLALRGSDADYAAIWEAVRAADWDQIHELYEGADYRLQCVALLARHEPAETAERLAGLLESENKQQLADAAAPLMAEYPHYDVVPVLLRFACCNDPACMAALERLRIPQVAFARLLWAALNQALEYKDRAIAKGEMAKDVPTGELKVSDPLRRQLVQLLGECTGDTLGDWERHYNRVIGQRPTPLSPELADQANRVVRAMNEWWFWQGKWAEVKQHRVYWLAINKMKEAGKKKQAELIESSATAEAGKQQVRLPTEKSPLYEALVAMEPFIAQAQAEIVGPPRVDLEAEGVDGLERTIAQYKDWIFKEHAIEFPKAAKTKDSEPAPPAK